jgi:hypothetical protein
MESWTSREITGLSTKSRIALRLLREGENKKKSFCYIAFISFPTTQPRGCMTPHGVPIRPRHIYIYIEEGIYSVSYFQRKYNIIIILSSTGVCCLNVLLVLKASENSVNTTFYWIRVKFIKIPYILHQRSLSSPFTYMHEVHLLSDKMHK